jgi:hypothetical protein
MRTQHLKSADQRWRRAAFWFMMNRTDASPIRRPVRSVQAATVAATSGPQGGSVGGRLCATLLIATRKLFTLRRL